MNVAISYTHARKLYDLAWHIKSSNFELKIWESLRGNPATVTVDITRDDYCVLIKTLRKPPRNANLTPGWVAELIRTLNEYALPIFVEETLEPTA